MFDLNKSVSIILHTGMIYLLCLKIHICTFCKSPISYTMSVRVCTYKRII